VMDMNVMAKIAGIASLSAIFAITFMSITACEQAASGPSLASLYVSIAHQMVARS
jgi:hypothetical protein